MRRFMGIALALVLYLALVSPAAAAGKWAYVYNYNGSYPAESVQSDIWTPTSSFGGVGSGTTSKAAVWVYGSSTWSPNAGWLVRPSTYSDPHSFYVYTDEYGNNYETILSQQSYNASRNYRISWQESNIWETYIVGTWRSDSILPSNGTKEVRVGGKTSADNNNLKASPRNSYFGDYNAGGINRLMTDTYSGESNHSPLVLSIINHNYNFDVYNSNY